MRTQWWLEVSVSLLWVLAASTATTLTTATVTSLIPTSSTLTSSPASGSSDEAFCSIRYLGSENSTADVGHDVVGIAAILELRSPLGQGCGHVEGTELQAATALLWAVRRINGEGMSPGVLPFIPGVRIDLRIYSDCSQSLLAGRHVGELFGVHTDFTCTPKTPPMAGVLGTTTSHTTTHVSSLLSSTRVPHFGVSATVSTLSDKASFPNFYRTVPSDLTQSKVLVDMVIQLQWTYVVGIYSSDNYGTFGFKEFKRLATEAGVCVFKEASFWNGHPNVMDSMEEFIRQLLIEMKKTRFGSIGIVYFGHDAMAELLFQTIHDRSSRWHEQDKVKNLHWLFSDGVGMSPQVANAASLYSNELFSISAATLVLQDVHDFFYYFLEHSEDYGPYWNSLVMEYLQDNCNSDFLSCSLQEKISFYSYISAALDSLYSLAALLSRAHQESCGGIPGVCSNLSKVLRDGLLSSVKPETLNYSLFFSEERLPEEFRNNRMLIQDSSGDFLPANTPLYFINSVQDGAWNTIGEYRNGTLTFQPVGDLSAIQPSECGTDCRECQKTDVVKFTYRPGDVVVLGLYSISASGPTDSFSCGDYRNQSSATAALMAFLHTLDVMSEQGGGENKDNGRRFGALVLDDCYNKLTASSLIADLFNKKILLVDPLTKTAINMSRVVAAVGSQSSSVTISALNLLTPLGIPTISYLATSLDLDDRVNFPFFLRPVPSDSVQARVLLELVQTLNITYVAAIHQNNNYGLRGIQQFVSLAERSGICVEKPVPVDDGLSNEALLQALRNMRSKAAVVVVAFVIEETAIRILDVIKGKNLGLVFLASEAWGVTMETLKNERGVTARGSLVLTVDVTKEAGDVKMVEYFKSLKTPSLTNQDNPWIRDFWENEMACNLPGGYTNAYKSMCNPAGTLKDNVTQELAKDQKVVQTINAVATIIKAMDGRCGKAVCILDLSAVEATNLMLNVTLVDKNQQEFRPYLSDGNGNVGFTVYNVQKNSAGSYSYVKIGKYDVVQGLQLDGGIVFYDPVGRAITPADITSTCKYKMQCKDICGVVKEQTTLPAVTATPVVESEGEGGLVAVVVVLALLCALLVALFIAAACCARRRNKIPFLGLVMRHSSSATLRRRSQASDMRGNTNEGFSTLSPRASLPLPPIPRFSTTALNDQYNDPSDTSWDTNVSFEGSPGACAPNTQRNALSVGSHLVRGEDGQRRQTGRQQFRPGPDLHDPRQRLQQRALSSSPQSPEMLRERARASSVPRVVRPDFLDIEGNFRQSPVSAGSLDPVPGTRPRSYSHDSATRSRLGAVSAEDHDLLMKYISSVQSQRQTHDLNAQRQQMQAMSPRVERAPPQTSQYVASPQDRLMVDSRAGTLNACALGHTSPSFCSCRSMIYSDTPEDLPPLYLHPVSSEQETYLQLIPDPPAESDVTSPTSPTVSSPRGSTTLLPTSPVVPPRSDVASISQQAIPLVSFPVHRQNLPVGSVASPSTLMPGSTTSGSSGAVFISPDRDDPSGRHLWFPQFYPVGTVDGGVPVSGMPLHGENCELPDFAVPAGVSSLASSQSPPQNRSLQSPSQNRTLSLEWSPHSPSQNRTLSPDRSPQFPSQNRTLSSDRSPYLPSQNRTLSPDRSPQSPSQNRTLSPDRSPRSPLQNRTLSPDRSPQSPSQNRTLSPDRSHLSPSQNRTLSPDIPQQMGGRTLNESPTVQSFVVTDSKTGGQYIVQLPIPRGMQLAHPVTGHALPFSPSPVRMGTVSNQQNMAALGISNQQLSSTELNSSGPNRAIPRTMDNIPMTLPQMNASSREQNEQLFQRNNLSITRNSQPIDQNAQLNAPTVYQQGSGSPRMGVHSLAFANKPGSRSGGGAGVLTSQGQPPEVLIPRGSSASVAAAAGVRSTGSDIFPVNNTSPENTLPNTQWLQLLGGSSGQLHHLENNIQQPQAFGDNIPYFETVDDNIQLSQSVENDMQPFKVGEDKLQQSKPLDCIQRSPSVEDNIHQSKSVNFSTQQALTTEDNFRKPQTFNNTGQPSSEYFEDNLQLPTYLGDSTQPSQSAKDLSLPSRSEDITHPPQSRKGLSLSSRPGGSSQPPQSPKDLFSPLSSEDSLQPHTSPKDPSASARPEETIQHHESPNSLSSPLAPEDETVHPESSDSHSAQPRSAGDSGVESVPCPQGKPRLQVPHPCGVGGASQAVGDGAASSHTSGDSGNGEDLTTDIDHEVGVVMC